MSDPESLTPIDRSGQHSAPHGYWHANHADRSHCGDGDHYYHDRYTRARSCGGASSGSDACVSDRHRHTYSGSWCHPDHTAANGDCRTHRDDGTHEANPCPDDSADDDDDDDACVSGRHEHTYSGSWCHLDHTAANGDCRTHRADGTHEANPCPDDDADGGGGGGCSVALGALGAGTVTRSGTWAAGCTSDNRGSAQVPYRAVRYTFSVAGAATATVGVSSSTDAYVYLTNADRSLSRHDNNSGAHSGDALLSAVTLAAAGYTVEATTAAPRQDGAFTMTLTIADAPDPPPDVVISGLADASATPAAGAATAAASDTFGVTPAGAACSATPDGATIAPATGTSRTVTHTVAAGTTVTVTVTCMTSTSTASADARFTADAAPVPDVEIDGLDHASATPDTDSTSAEVTDTFTVTPAAARCSAQATPGTPQVAPATGTSRTVTLDVAAGTAVWVIVICNHHTNRDLAAARFTAHPTPTNTDTTTPPPAATPTPPTTTTPTANSDDCNDTLGTLTAATPPTTGTLAATDGCTSTRHPRKTATSTYQARRHTFTLNSPGWVTITLESAATNTQRIDTYLVLLRGHTPDGTGTYITHNDDAQNAATHSLHWRDSRLADVFLQPGHYTIETTTYHAHSTTNPARTTGDYDLTVEATLTGLQETYDAVVDETLAIGFETGDYVARVQSISPPTLDWSTGRTGSRSSLAVTADMADTHRVVLTLAKPSSTAASQARSASSTSSTMSTVEFDVAAACGAGLAASDRNGHLCVRAAAQASTTNYPEDRVTETGRGRKYPVTLGTLWGVKKVAKDARDAYMNPSPGTTRACTPTANRIAAIMLSIPLFEVPNIEANTYLRHPARSPMALSRWDRDHSALYSNNDKTGGPARAFWNPGVGLWQLDDRWWHDGGWYVRHLGHGERAEIHIGGRAVADYLAESLCAVSDRGMEAAVKSALDPWLACVDKDMTPREHRCYEWSYLKLWVKATDDLHVTSYSTGYPGGTLDYRSDFSTSGGLSRLKCRWGTSGVPFSCWFYDTDNPEGWMLDEDPAAATTSQSPLAAPFMSFVEDGHRFAVYPESFLGTQTTLIKAVPVATNVRHTTASSWTPDRYSSQVLQVEICRVIAVEAGSVCEWVSTTLNSGPHTFARKLRDAGH
ncbi:hypothetical protein [Candidatus Poriferisodalis sp.]|uniref:hypothetical protein n=1 Tax=Candidatus Poriferisodalis sp. TaxID=3101277 RepID=UPI003AF4166B